MSVGDLLYRITVEFTSKSLDAPDQVWLDQLYAYDAIESAADEVAAYCGVGFKIEES